MDVTDNALRPKKLPGGDVSLLGAAGGLLLLLSGFFLWQELKLDATYLVLLTALAGLVASLVKRPALARFGVGLLCLSGVGGGAWYALTRSGTLLPALGVSTLGMILAAAVTYPRARLGDRSIGKLVFIGLALTTLCATWAGYFHFFTLGLAADSVSRRLVLTMLWVLCGVALVVLGGRMKEGPMRSAGYLFVAAAVAKAVGYDTTHLYGALRVAVLAGAGGALIGGAALARGRR